MLHNSEGNCCGAGSGCCDRPLVIYAAALTKAWTARLPRSPQVLPGSTQQQTQMGPSDLLWLGDNKGTGKAASFVCHVWTT